MATKNVTFWAYHDDRFQGIHLTQGGDPVRFHEGGPTDEGWSSSDVEYEWCEGEDFIRCSEYTDGRDCDGRLSTEWHGRCPIDKLTALPEEDDESGYRPARPAWVEVRRGQRDYSAEAMGY